MTAYAEKGRDRMEENGDVVYSATDLKGAPFQRLKSATSTTEVAVGCTPTHILSDYHKIVRLVTLFEK